MLWRKEGGAVGGVVLGVGRAGRAERRESSGVTGKTARQLAEELSRAKELSCAGELSCSEKLRREQGLTGMGAGQKRGRRSSRAEEPSSRSRAARKS
jgi:hypothetical protein